MLLVLVEPKVQETLVNVKGIPSEPHGTQESDRYQLHLQYSQFACLGPGDPECALVVDIADELV